MAKSLTVGEQVELGYQRLAELFEKSWPGRWKSRSLDSTVQCDKCHAAPVPLRDVIVDGAAEEIRCPEDGCDGRGAELQFVPSYSGIDVPDPDQLGSIVKRIGEKNG